MGLWLEGRTEAGPHTFPCPKWERSSFQNFLFFRTFLFFLLPHWIDTPWGTVCEALEWQMCLRTGRSFGGSQGSWNKAETLSIWQGRQEGRHLLLAPHLAKVLSVVYYVDGTWPLTSLVVSLSSLSPHDTVPAMLASMLFPHIPSASLLLVNFLLDVRPITVYSILKSSHLNILKLLGIRLTLWGLALKLCLVGPELILV